jgi:hypothetical protein
LRLLLLLIESRPQPVTQRALRDALWPQTHVGYTSLAQVVAEVRKAIGDEPGVEPMIRTVPRVGYAFAAPLAGEEPVALPNGAWPVADLPAAPAVESAGRWQRAWKAAALAAALLLAGASGAVLSRWLQEAAPPAPPRFTQLTFRRGILMSARFSGDGQTVVYSALWDGGLPEIFVRRLDSPASVSLRLPPSTLLSVSSKGELAVLVAPPGERGVVWLGTLARVPLSGGPLRPVLDGVLDADWSPDGRELAAIRWSAGQFQLEYPLGHVLLRPCLGTKLRVSPGGDRVALLEPDGLRVVDPSGGSRRLPLPAAHQRLAWSSDASLLVDASDSDLQRTLRQVSLDGTIREICALAGTLVVHDVARDGRVLIHHGFERWSVRARAPGEAEEHDASVDANSQVQGLSADGERILLWDGGEGPPGSALLHPTRGGVPLRLGEGRPMGLSADAAWVLLDRTGVSGRRVVLAPTGAGTPRPLPLGRLQLSGPFHVAGEVVLFNAAEPGRPARAFRFVTASGQIRPLTPEGTIGLTGLLPSGEFLARAADGTLSLQAPSSSTGRGLSWRLPADPFLEAVGFIDGGRALLVRSGSMPARLERVELASGAREHWRTLAPPDATAVGHIWTILVMPDGRGYAYTHGYFLEDLFLVDGLRR